MYWLISLEKSMFKNKVIYLWHVDTQFMYSNEKYFCRPYKIIGREISSLKYQQFLLRHNETYVALLNKNPTRRNSMQVFIYCKITLHVLGVTAPTIRSTKNCNRSLRSGQNIGTATSLQHDRIGKLEGSSRTDIMTCIGGCGYSF